MLLCFVVALVLKALIFVRLILHNLIMLFTVITHHQETVIIFPLFTEFNLFPCFSLYDPCHYYDCEYYASYIAGMLIDLSSFTKAVLLFPSDFILHTLIKHECYYDLMFNLYLSTVVIISCHGKMLVKGR